MSGAQRMKQSMDNDDLLDTMSNENHHYETKNHPCVGYIARNADSDVLALVSAPNRSCTICQVN